jgi:hypothetical protein
MPDGRDDPSARPRELEFRLDGGRRVGGVLPVDVHLPRFGAVMFVAAELTEESRAPALDFDYERTNRR